MTRTVLVKSFFLTTFTQQKGTFNRQDKSNNQASNETIVTSSKCATESRGWRSTNTPPSHLTRSLRKQFHDHDHEQIIYEFCLCVSEL